MGNLHSNITQRIQQFEFFDKNWFSGIIGRLRRLREEIVERAYALVRNFQFQQEPAHRHIASTGTGGPVTRSRSRSNVAIENPSDFGVLQDRIEVYNNNEMKLVYFVCVVNLLVLAFLFNWVFI
ncbi:hypothetical protein GCK72_007074 [Caenorhabditis remanei]|uniref:Uncharacterized protein n=2 Tax=Caenorhabditis remanei TaxID=31234 RepID=A0A2P4WDS1_CAERE|nr:hypothetical protein GCK72_007074 [Caenorhabditis remanei]KAF1767116.1 hypothetical protein GCK72_007074 [Caenorhabditis remanei]